MTTSITRSMSFEGLVYHVFPLGACGADAQHRPAGNIRRLERLTDHLKQLGVRAVLLGPVLHASSHGYDSRDLYRIDPRLGTNEDFIQLIAHFHREGLAVLMDAVFNHSGREFFAFQDLLRNGESSYFRNWYAGIDFSQRGPQGEGFNYECWDGHSELPKFNLKNQEVRDHLFGALELWITRFGIDGLRLDAADVIDPDFWPELSRRCEKLYQPVVPMAFGGRDFYLMGEMVFGNYAEICSDTSLDSVTNYELYKALYSSLNDDNYFELAHALQRQFGPQGLYNHIKLFNFLDNHDVNRIASTLNNKAHLYPLHIALFSVPGLPSLYYGSEWGVEAVKARDDWPLRPMLPDDPSRPWGPQTDLAQCITRLAKLRGKLSALHNGSFQLLSVQSSQLAFIRQNEEQRVLVILNSDAVEATMTLPAAQLGAGSMWRDYLNDSQNPLTVPEANLDVSISVPPCWGSILVNE